MTTLTGSIRNADGTYWDGAFKLKPTGSVFGYSNLTTVGLPIIVECNGATNNSYEVDVLAGAYDVYLPGRAPFSISVPDDSGSYSIEELAGEPFTYSFSSYPVFASIAEAEAAVILGTRVDVDVDGNGDTTRFRRDDTYTGPLDGVSGFEDAVGSIFRRYE